MALTDAGLTESRSAVAAVLRTHPVTTFGYWKCDTAAGMFAILPHEGKWLALLEDKWLGAYRTPREALNCLIRDRAPEPMSFFDPQASGIPGDLSEWDFVRV